MAEQCRAYLLSPLVLVSVTGRRMLTPLFLDSILPVTAPLLNITPHSYIPIQPATPSWQRLDPLVQITFSMGLDSVLLGLVLLAIKTFWPQQLGEKEKNFPKRYLLGVGLAQAANALMFQLSSPGGRTPTYLQAFLGNFSIPTMFTLRFLLLGKRPTVRKGLCALVIMTAGLVALIPTFFPSLETSQQHTREGGATGAWRVIWPLFYILQTVPHILSNIILEIAVKHSVQSSRKSRAAVEDSVQHPPRTGDGFLDHNASNDNHNVTIQDAASAESGTTPSTCIQNVSSAEVDTQEGKQERLNMVYTLFWTFTSTFLGALSLFWVDFIPVFGMQSNIKEFLPQVVFNLRCILGLTEVCGITPIALAWGRMIVKTSAFVLTALLLRYGEGGNYYILICSAVTPISFVFWALFDEHPFRWSPMADLSTWLSVGAIIVMLPALVIYQRGAPEIVKERRGKDLTMQVDSQETTEDTAHLLTGSATTQGEEG